MRSDKNYLQNKKVIGSLIITIVAVIMVLCIGPLDVFTHGYYSDVVAIENINQEDYLGKIDLGQGSYTGEFIPKKKHFAGLELCFLNMPEGNTGTVTVSISDKNGRILESSDVDLSRVVTQNWYRVYFDAKLEVGSAYYYTVEAKECASYPYLQIVDADYLGTENTGENILMGYMYSESTFMIPEKVLLNMLIVVIWMVIMGKILLPEKSQKAISIIATGLIMTFGMTWNYMFNSLDNHNEGFSTFLGESESLVTGVIYAEQNGMELSKYGLGIYTDYRGSHSSNTMQFINDDNWTYGYSKVDARIVISNQEYMYNNSNAGNYLQFSNGDTFLITAHEVSEGNLIISLDANGPLNYFKYGNLANAKFLDSNKQLLPSSELQEYGSQYGLQGKVFRYLSRYISLENMLIYFNFLCSFATAVVFSLIVLLIWKKYNTLMAGCFFVTFLLSPWVINFARNLYWVEFTWFIPMLSGLFCALLINSRKCRMLSYVVAFIAIIVKCLCGYEYIATIMMGLITFLFVDMIKSIIAKDRKQFVLIFRTTFIMGVVALAGFMVAICIHANIRGEGNLAEGINSIIQNDVLRRAWGGDMNDFDAVYWDSFNSSSWYVFSKYFHFSTEVIAGVEGNLFPALCIIPLVIFVYNYKHKKINWNDLSLYGICFFTAISWFILAKQHSYIHTHMNYVLWYFGYVQICFYIILNQITNFIKEKKEV